jgi:hypothetical protein
MPRKRGQREPSEPQPTSRRHQVNQPLHDAPTGRQQRGIWDQDDEFDEDYEEEEESDDDKDQPSPKRRSTRKRRRDAGIPRMQPRDIRAFRWIGEQGAARRDDLQDLLGRMPEGETNEPGRLSASRVRHIIDTNSQSIVEKMVVSPAFLPSTPPVFLQAPTDGATYQREYGPLVLRLLLERARARPPSRHAAFDGRRFVSRRGPQGATGADAQDR